MSRALDPADPRLAQLAALSEKGVAIIGYPDDEGISLNGGRAGAALGPSEIRRWLYRMTPHARRTLKAFWDLGDLDVSPDLEERHERARAEVYKALSAGHQVLSFGAE